METVVHTSSIDAPAHAVWEVVADLDRDREWRGDLQWSWHDPAGLVTGGTRIREVLRLVGRRYRYDGVVEAVDEGRSFHWRSTDGLDARGSRTVTPLAGDRCEVTLEVRVNPQGLDRVLAPLVNPVLEKAGERDLRSLAALVTSLPAPVS